MTHYLVAALVTGLVCAIPGALNASRALLLGALGASIAFLIYWIGAVSFAWPLYGVAQLIVAAITLLHATAAETGSADKTFTRVALATVVAIIALNALAGLEALRWRTYAQLIGPVETRVWSRDIQPKSPDHMKQVPCDIAAYTAAKALSQDGAIGSQFALDTSHATMQKINGRLACAIPLDYRSFSVWTASPGIPAYVLVDAENPYAAPELVKVAEPMTVTPGAYFYDDLERIVQNAHPDLYAYSYRFEVDETRKPHWVAAMVRPTIGWHAPQLVTIAVVDPANGAIEDYAPSQVPDWIDVVYPQQLIHQYLAYNGDYAISWWNSVWGQEGITEPEATEIVYGQDGALRFVTGMTSASSSDQSLVYLAYSDPRTGRTLRYETPGGATDTAIIAAVEANPAVSYLKLTATAPQIYNVLGVQSALVIMRNESGGFAGAALVDVHNIQDVAYAATTAAAFDAYKGIVERHLQQANVASDNGMTTIDDDVIDRISAVAGSENYLLHLKGSRHLFSAAAPDFPTLPLAQPGDHVSLIAQGRLSTMLALKEFKDKSLPLIDTAPAQERPRASAQ